MVSPFTAIYAVKGDKIRRGFRKRPVMPSVPSFVAPRG